MPSVVGTPTTATTGSTTSATTTIDVPAGVQDGDWLLVAWRDQNSVGTQDMTNAAFERITAPFVSASSLGRITGIYRHIVTDAGSEPASYSFTRSGTATRRIGVMWIARPDDPDGTFEVSGYSTPYEGVTGTDRGAASYAGDGLTFVVAGGEFSAGADHALASVPAGYTTIATAATDGAVASVSRTAGWVGYKTSTGTVAAMAVDFVGAPTALAVQSVTLEYVPPVVIPPTQATVEVVGVGTANLSVWTGTAEVPITRLEALPHTSYSITEMEADIAADRDVYWAHRGGSLDWSEMTMRAYTNAVWRGCRALEVSVRRSLDGVWIMSHDATLSRVTGGVKTSAISTTNAATMLDTPVVVPASGGVIGRIEDVLPAWPRMLWIIDNKTGESPAELFTIIKALIPDWQDRVIIKIDGAQPVAHFSTAQAAGFKTAAYFYGDTTDAKITQNMPYVDYPGMDYNAGQDRWDYVAAFAKPIWGHVLPSLSAKDTAKTKGAVIFQCAALKAIMPPVNDIE
jgi:hypothetical protein